MGKANSAKETTESVFSESKMSFMPKKVYRINILYILRKK